MCVTCAYAAAAGVSGARVWLQTRRWRWLTRPRLRRLTVAGIVIATLGTTVSLQPASSPPPPAAVAGED